jgi:elongator complex protein 3
MREIILEIVKNKPKSIEDLSKIKRVLAKKHKGTVIRNSDILKEYRLLVAENIVKKDEMLEDLLKKRAVRTMSGVAPVAVLTKPWACPGKCAYCPHEKDVPTSYLSNEPAVMRAIRNKYNPFTQTYSRLESLEANGHRPEKIELIVIGGTWSVLPRAYKYWFIKECFRAANAFQSKIKNYELRNNKVEKLKKQLLAEQKKNEKAKYKIIGLTLETRPDYINEEELRQMRELGATRVELGVQAIDDDILKKNKRGHGVDVIAKATALLRSFGFKITYHLMPGLPGATAKKDLELFKKTFSDERFQPDQIKFYPTVVTKGSLLYKWWKDKKYKPYSGRVLENLIIECKKVIPPYVRILRLIRDIPGESILAGNLVTNLRQVMQQKGVKCNCIRCRECQEKKVLENNFKINILQYEAAAGREYFISADSLDGKILYGFCRLRLSHSLVVVDKKYNFLNDSAIVRELHVYGELVPAGEKKKTQHAGLGQKLLVEAEKIAKENGFKKIAIISGVGARGYYRKNGYKAKNTYMIKYL